MQLWHLTVIFWWADSFLHGLENTCSTSGDQNSEDRLFRFLFPCESFLDFGWGKNPICIFCDHNIWPSSPLWWSQKKQIGLFSHPKSKKFSHGNRKRKSLSSSIWCFTARYCPFLLQQSFCIRLSVQFLRINSGDWNILISRCRTCIFKSMQKRIRSSKNNSEMPQLRSLALATTWPIHRDFCATVYRVMATVKKSYFWRFWKTILPIIGDLTVT